MDNKLEQLTAKLYEEGLQKGRSDAKNIVDEAKAEAKKIADKAKAEADKTVEGAKRSAEENAKNSRTELALAGKQTVAALKESIADMIIAQSTAESVKAANLDPAFVKDMLLAVASNWNGEGAGKTSLSALLPTSKEKEFDKVFEKSAKELLGKGIEMKFSSSVDSGFKIGPKEGGYHISFSDADFNALLGEYLRPKLYEILFGKNNG